MTEQVGVSLATAVEGGMSCRGCREVLGVGGSVGIVVMVLWASIVQNSSNCPFFKKDFIYLFLERRKEGERRGETSMCGCFFCAPYWGTGSQSRHVP